jgi:hypothetical protein
MRRKRGEKTINRFFDVFEKSEFKTSNILKNRGSKLLRNSSPSKELVRKGCIFKVKKRERKEENKKLGM